ncbi:hypothetical protein ACFX19_044302 [Malus domestica]
MQGRRSLNLALSPIDHELKKTLRNQQQKHLSQGEVLETPPTSEKESEMAEQDREIMLVKRPIRDSFDPQDLDQPSRIAFQPNIDGTCMLSPQLLNMLPHFNGESLKEDHYAHIQEFFDICKTQHIRGLSANKIKLLLFPFSLKRDVKVVAFITCQFHHCLGTIG